ncbi:hypothetical protein [Nocardioides jishulii]|uniref:DUF4913 domain-containing protein n=1 Tax=Nocardioides jishulii TaxID=2575440 RepID=A0A4U2YPF8_9ACTN|nr:hypothetical protein [Nocardioides jishulii]QCX27739.1 hypothetical protein FCL41_09525 [Nocardioides jishulii]TKI62545.1 hypothetical protein FC770_09190 [Nocardioides jishulii]
MDPYGGYEATEESSSGPFQRDDLPGAVNWNLLLADEADYEWHDLDRWVKWLKTSHGLSPSIVPPFYYLHDELVWELSALHTHWLSCYHQTASPSAPIAWRRDFEDTKHRLRDWVAISGTRLDRDRPTRVTFWPGETPVVQPAEITIQDRDGHFEEFVRQDVQRRRRIEASVNSPLVG